MVNGVWSNDTLINTAANVVTYLDKPGAGTYRYRVRAFNGAGVSAWTGWLQASL
jgi:hypothetical protein